MSSSSSSSSLSFVDRVAIVTGAGGGLGRAYAIQLAKAGCKVVVNDLGGSTKGEGQNSAAADAVVKEIVSHGGIAVANYDSVINGDRIVKTAIDNFGRIDILINNAGILRDVPFARMQENDWKLIIDVHLNGVYAVTKAAFPHMLKQKYGRIIMISSAVGLYGNYGQANYGAVKLGVVGFANTLAKEGVKANIFTNVVAPIAASRMTESFLPPDVLESLKPENVSPLVCFLAHQECQENGSTFEVGGGWVSKVRWERSKGVFFPLKSFTIEGVKAGMEKINDFTDSTRPTSLQDTMMPLLENAAATASESSAAGAAAPTPAAAPAAAAPVAPKAIVAQTPASAKPSAPTSSNPNIDVAAALAHEFAPISSSYTERDVVLYALGIGAASDQLDDKELRFTYELHPNFQVLPTFGVVIPSAALGAMLSTPGLTFNPMMLLHGEQYMEIIQPLKVNDTLMSIPKISNIYDKGTGALMILDVTTKNQAGETVLFNQFSLFIRGLGKFGGSKGPTAPSYDPPTGLPPDVVHREKTLDNQALLYRLSGDYNPLHADPNMASMGGFNKPILHGLCTLGYASRAVLRHYCDNDTSKFKSIRVRFVKHVFPGETLITQMWRISHNQIVFRVKVAERGEFVLANAVITLNVPAEQVSAAPAPAAAAAGAATSATTGALTNTNSGFKAESIFIELQKRASVDLVKKVGASFRFDLSKGAEKKIWLLDLKSGAGSIAIVDEKSKADAIIAMSDDDFPSLMNGTLNPQKAFMNGKLKIKGNMMLAQKLSLLTPKPSKL